MLGCLQLAAGPLAGSAQALLQADAGDIVFAPSSGSQPEGLQTCKMADSGLNMAPVRVVCLKAE